MGPGGLPFGTGVPCFINSATMILPRGFSPRGRLRRLKPAQVDVRAGFKPAAQIVARLVKHGTRVTRCRWLSTVVP